MDGFHCHNHVVLLVKLIYIRVSAYRLL